METDATLTENDVRNDLQPQPRTRKQDPLVSDGLGGTDPLSDPLSGGSQRTRPRSGGGDPPLPDDEDPAKDTTDQGNTQTQDGTGGSGGTLPPPQDDPEDEPENLDTASPVTLTGEQDQVQITDQIQDETVSTTINNTVSVQTEQQDTGLDTPKTATLRTPSGLSVDTDRYQIDPTTVPGPEQFLADNEAYQKYTAGDMNAEQSKSFGDRLKEMGQSILSLITGRNEELATEKSATEQRDVDIESKLQKDTEAAEVQRDQDIKGAKKDKTARDGQVRSDYYKKKGALKTQERNEQNSARNTTSSTVNNRRNQVNAETRQRKNSANAEARKVRANAEARKRREIRKAEEEERNKSYMEMAYDYVTDIATAAWNRIKNSVNAFMRVAYNKASQILSAAKRAVDDMLASLETWASQQWAVLRRDLAAISKRIGAAISEAWLAAEEKWNELSTWIDEKVNEITTAAYEVFEDLKNQAQDFIQRNWDALTTAASEIANRLAADINDAWQNADIFWDGRYGGEELDVENLLALTPEERAVWLHNATRGMGADVDMIMKLISGNKRDVELLAQAYKDKYGQELKDVISRELSGVQLAMAIEFLERGTIPLYIRIQRGIGFWGADTEAIVYFYERAPDKERLELWTGTEKKYTETVELMERRLGAAVLRRLQKGIDMKTGALLQTAEAFYDRMRYRTDGLGTDEAGLYADIELFAKKNPAAAYKAAMDENSQIMRLMRAELSDREYAKARSLMLGDSGNRAAGLLNDPNSTEPESLRITKAVVELFRPVSIVVQTERDKWFTKEEQVYEAIKKFYAALASLKAAVSAEMYEKVLSSREYTLQKSQLENQLGAELDARELAKAKALMERGKQNEVDKLREEVASFWIINDRVILDAVMAMSPEERKELRQDETLMLKIKGGVTAEAYKTVCAVVGYRMSGVGIGADGEINKDDVIEANNLRLSAYIMDGARSGKIDRVFDAVLEAQTLAEKGEAELSRIVKLIKPVASRMPRHRRVRGRVTMPTNYLQIWQALEGTRKLTSRDRLAMTAKGAGTDEAGMKATIADLSGVDLLENWTDIQRLRNINAALEEAIRKGDDVGEQRLRRQQSAFILDIHPDVEGIIKAETGGNELTEMLGLLRKKIRDATKSDPIFQLALIKENLRIDDLYREKMEYVQFDEERRIHYEEGLNIIDPFTQKDEAIEDSDLEYMGLLRSANLAQQRGELEDTKKMADALASINETQQEAESRLKSYKDLKSAVADITALIASAVVATLVTVFTGGIGAPFMAAVLTAAAAGAAGAAAAVAAKEIIQGGSYSVTEEGAREVVMGAVTGMIGGAIGGAIGSIGQLTRLSTRLGRQTFVFLGRRGVYLPAAKYIGKGVAAAIPKIPEGILSGTTDTLLAQIVGPDGAFHKGWEGFLAQLGPQVINKVGTGTLGAVIGAGLKAGATSTSTSRSTTSRLGNSVRNTLVDTGTGLVTDAIVSGGDISEDEMMTKLLNGAVALGKGALAAGFEPMVLVRAANTLNEERLVKIKNVDAGIARAIIRRREEVGKFKNLDELDLFIKTAGVAPIERRGPDPGSIRNPTLMGRPLGSTQEEEETATAAG